MRNTFKLRKTQKGSSRIKDPAYAGNISRKLRGPHSGGGGSPAFARGGRKHKRKGRRYRRR